MNITLAHSTESAGQLRILLTDSRTACLNSAAHLATTACAVHTASTDNTTYSAYSDVTIQTTRAMVQAESALSRKLTSTALEIYLRRTPSPEELTCELRDPGQKPYFPAYPDFHYNISHSDGIVVCGISDHPIGIDIQRIPKNPDRIMKIAKRFFSEEEQKALIALKERCKRESMPVLLSNHQQDALHSRHDNHECEAMCRLFCRYWTARESYIKLIGRGLAEPFENFRPDLDVGVVHTSQHDCTDSTGPFSEGTFFLTECPAPEGFCLTVCSTVPLPSCTPEEIYNHS